MIQSFSLLFLTVVMAISTLNASKLMHKTMLDTVLKSPMSYFDTTPLGRIVNRYLHYYITHYTFYVSSHNWPEVLKVKFLGC